MSDSSGGDVLMNGCRVLAYLSNTEGISREQVT
jgi:hypothetical protein